MVDSNPSPSFYRAFQSTLLWGCIGTAVAVVLTVVAAMMRDIRWILIFAWPFASFAGW